MSRDEETTAIRWPGGNAVWRPRLEAIGGLLLFLGALVFFGLWWRLDIFMTDSGTLVNGLGALAEGHLNVSVPVRGDLASPGMHEVDGLVVARNYGQIVLALPFLFLLRGVSLVANLHVALVAAWHLLALAFVVGVGRTLGRERLAAMGGSAVVLVSFLGNLLLARQLPEYAPYVASLQLLTLLAAAASAVVCYRLVAALHDRRVGLFAGSALVLATPLAFWSAAPKRHVFTGLAVFVVLWAFQRSRATAADGDPVLGLVSRPTAYRSLAYATVGLYAWIHAGEALFMLGALALVDLLTAPRNDARALLTVGAVFGLSLLPMLVTNLAISGDPLTPPRLLPAFTPDGGTVRPGTAEVFTGGGTDGTGGLGILARVRDLAIGGVASLLGDPDRVYHTYVRSRSLGAMTLDGGAGQFRFAAANLSFVESMPLAGGLVASGVAAVVLAWRWVRNRGAAISGRLTATDGLAVAVALTFAVLYAQELPLVAQYTVRYLFPLFPLSIYGLARLGATRGVISGHGRLVGWTYAGGVLVGGQLAFAYVVASDLAVGEAFRLHALVNLALAAALAVTLAVAVLRPSRDRPAAVALGLAAAATTVFLVLAAVVYFPIGRFLLPVVQALADLVAAA